MPKSFQILFDIGFLVKRRDSVTFDIRKTGFWISWKLLEIDTLRENLRGINFRNLDQKNS